MATPWEIAQSLLFEQLDQPGEAHDRPCQGRRPACATRASASIDALVAVGVLTAAEGDEWKAVKAGAHDRPPLADGAREQAAGLLHELLDETSADRPVTHGRFRGALSAAAELGVVDADEWEARLRARFGWLSLEQEREWICAMSSGGTEQQLLAVLAGPAEAVEGARVLYALRFADGISFAVVLSGNARRRALLWGLRDDVGTRYGGCGFGGGNGRFNVTFRTPPPPKARWVELFTPAGGVVRVTL